MGAGKAKGKNTDYQIQCRDVLVYLNSELRPYEGDGVDVPFDVGGSARTMDVALIDGERRITVAECKRRMDPTKLIDIDAFARRVDLIRERFGGDVDGVFFTKTRFQIGGVRAASWAGIDVIVFNEGQPFEKFSMSYQLYDTERCSRLQRAVQHCTGTVTPTATLQLEITRKTADPEPQP